MTDDKHTEERPRPHDLGTVAQRIQTGYDPVYVRITVDEDGDPFELFLTTGRSGGLFNSTAEAIGKLASLALRHGVPPAEVAETLAGIRADRVGVDNGDDIYSIPDAAGVALLRYCTNNMGSSIRDDDVTVARDESH